MLSISNHSLGQKTRHTTRQTTRHIKAVPHDAIVVPEFLVAYSTYICKNPECVQNMILPPAYEQLFIMQQMFDLTSKVNISGLEGPFMKLFIMHDTQGVEVLANALVQYQKSKEVIESVVEYTKDIPGLVIDTVEM